MSQKKIIINFGVKCCPPTPPSLLPRKVESILPAAPVYSALATRFLRFLYILLLSTRHRVYSATTVCHHVMSLCHVHITMLIRYCLDNIYVTTKQ